MKRDIPVIAVCIGDSTSLIQSKHTINTLKSLQNFANKTKKALNLMYVNNVDYRKEGDSLFDPLVRANQIIFNSVSNLAIFLSGNNKDIDHQDMVMVFDPALYSTIKVSPGLYGLSIHGETEVLPEDYSVVLSRVLAFNDEMTLPKELGEAPKAGTVLDSNISELYKNVNGIVLYTYTNFLNTEINRITSFIEHEEKKAAKLKAQEIDVQFEGSLEDDDGMVL
jgi:hypothetical protein